MLNQPVLLQVPHLHPPPLSPAVPMWRCHGAAGLQRGLKSGHCSEGGESPAGLMMQAPHLHCPAKDCALFLFLGCSPMCLYFCLIKFGGVDPTNTTVEV